MANATGVVDLEASADATGRVVTYSIELSQRMLKKTKDEPGIRKKDHRLKPTLTKLASNK